MKWRFVFVAATGLPLNAYAEELAWRCDRISSPGAVLLFIDTSRNTVHWGKDPNSGWYVDSRKYQTREKDVPKQPGEDTNYVGCVFDWAQFVHISDDYLEFGVSSMNSNWCGMDNDPTRPGGKRSDFVFSVNRATRYANLSGVADSTPDYKCEKFIGNPL
jgi:hypothetical protein